MTTSGAAAGPSAAAASGPSARVARYGHRGSGPTNSLSDVAGVRVGHETRIGAGWLSGTTVVLAPEGGLVAGVDVRGGGPGTRETDLLDPRASVERVHAIVFSGGSAYGLAAASGVADLLGERGIGFPVGDRPGEVVPIVPSAVVFDLGRGGDFGRRPGHAEGVAAARVALAAEPGTAVTMGVVGAGAGTLAGGLKGGIGSASAVLSGGATVAALVVLNSHGTCVDPATGEPLAARLLAPGDVRLRRPDQAEARAWVPPHFLPPTVVQNTTLGLVATDLTLTKAQCTKLAGVGQDGLARAIDPAHTLFDGDTIFGASTATRPAPDLPLHYELLDAAARCVSRAVVRALLAAEPVTTSAGSWPSYSSVFPSAVR
ncbi:P1 family peptidase [Cryptosporangium phraense]|uniref:P1 family peptidase n=1 Tax=Cryptosporangium phraense TaxID=2593070 RepID=A0A545AQ49_9ACTN|nr:P1 family peptidase [Cryptosporangium phraense]TQS43452.1 P1 family peptidase [Cryptosporangium phraense]